jgi:hypothetical protein
MCRLLPSFAPFVPRVYSYAATANVLVRGHRPSSHGGTSAKMEGAQLWFVASLKIFMGVVKNRLAVHFVLLCMSLFSVILFERIEILTLKKGVKVKLSFSNHVLYNLYKTTI